MVAWRGIALHNTVSTGLGISLSLRPHSDVNLEFPWPFIGRIDPAHYSSGWGA